MNNYKLTRSPFSTDIAAMAVQMPPAFSGQKLRGHLTHPSFRKRWRYCDVDLSRVVSVEHPGHAGSTWGTLLGVTGSGSPLRNVRDAIWELEREPRYYLQRKRKKGWFFYEVEGDYYLECGLHRTVVGRYFLELNGLPPIVHRIGVMSLTAQEWVTGQQQALERERGYGLLWDEMEESEGEVPR